MKMKFIKGNFSHLLHRYFVVINLLLLSLTSSTAVSSSAEDIKLRCIEREKQALLNLKAEFIDDYGRLSSWGTEGSPEDCCLWSGIQCDNGTNHIIKLDLHGPVFFDARSSMHSPAAPLRGKISTSLLELQHLEYLDFSFNDFNISQIPEFISSLDELLYLNLSQARFGGQVPQHLANLTRLQFLDLKLNDFVKVHDNLDWISGLRSLRYLDLSDIDLRTASDWIQAISNLPALKELYLSFCRLPEVLPPNYSINSSSSLATFDLSFNYLSSSFLYQWLFNFSSSLRTIDLSDNDLKGPIPDDFASMVMLEHLIAQNCKLEGGIPSFFGNLSSLKSLELTHNSLTGKFPEVMMNLSGRAKDSLMFLDLSWNRFRGSLPDISIFSSLVGLRLRGNQLDESFHEGNGQLKDLIILDASENQLSGVIPDLSSYFPSLRELYLDHNQFNGTLTESIGGLSKLEILILASNHLEGIISEVHLVNVTQLQDYHM